MKYLFINSVYGKRSTGKIIAEQCHKLGNEGHECCVAYGRESIHDSSVQLIQIGTKFDYMLHGLITRLFDLHGFGSRRATKKFLRQVEVYSPDVVWLHNLHGYYINIELLFQWLKEHPQIKVYWTLHDCWAFTGHCSYFTVAKCEQWKQGCTSCSQLNEYPKTYGLDCTARNYRRKLKTFTGVQSLQLIVPSEWLANLTRESFLRDYPVQVVHNTVDLSVFRPTNSNFREKYGLADKYIILGVAVGWEKTKGIFDIIKLREILPQKYTIVLVGAITEKVDKFPDGIIILGRTKDQQELAGIYTTADVLVNPTHQDNYPTVNLEAQACGTPVVTYNVGGSPESVPMENIVDEHDILSLSRRIRQICEKSEIGMSK